MGADLGRGVSRPANRVALYHSELRTVRGGDHWTVAGELELPSVNQSRLTTSYEATVKSLCSDVAERHCWEMEALTLGSVPATVPTGSERAPKAHVDTSSDTPILAELTSSSEEPAASTEPAKAMTEDEDLAFIFKEPSGKEAAGSPEQEDLEFILSEAHSGQSALEELENDIQSAEPKPAAPQYDPALVRRIQSGLAGLGYDPGPVDGIVGRQTRTAIKSFRRREQLASGDISAELLDVITNRLGASEAAPTPADNPSQPQLHQPEDARKQPWSCNSINPKNRDCGA